MVRGFENVCEITSNCASKGLGKSLGEAVYKYNKEEKKKLTHEVALVTLKMPQIEQSSATRQVCCFSFLFIV